ncbi:ABC transporter permease [Labrys wisconsinensis]|uniref:ABC transporter permease n=1 Tax=Labrys wisconsinensis TaxID=425677 RepID=UPI0027D8007E|nr:ABC transporter permease [Labrys wisconsinensis]
MTTAPALQVQPAVPLRRSFAGFGPTVPALALVLLFFVVPVLALLLRSVLEPQPGLQNYAEVFGSTTYLKVFTNTFLVAGLVTLVTLLLAFPVAWLLAIAPRPWSTLLFGIIILSMWTNLLARTYAWMVLLQRTGIINRALMQLGLIAEPLALINNLVGVTIGMTYIMLPFMILPLHATIRTLDPAVFQAASLCGASRLQAFTRVFLPLVASGVAAGVLMVFVMSLGYFVTPALLGGTSNMMLAELIAQLVQSLLNWGLAGAAAVVLLAVTLAIYAVQIRFFGFGTPAR